MPMSLREEPEELRDRLLELTVGSEAEPAPKALRGAAEGPVELIGEVVDPDPRLWEGRWAARRAVSRDAGARHRGGRLPPRRRRDTHGASCASPARGVVSPQNGDVQHRIGERDVKPRLCGGLA